MLPVLRTHPRISTEIREKTAQRLTWHGPDTNGAQAYQTRVASTAQGTLGTGKHQYDPRLHMVGSSTAQVADIVIPNRFRGPPDSGHGGYCAGAFAEVLPEQVVEVTLRSPIPRDTPLQLRRGPPADVRYRDSLIAEMRSADLQLEVPAPPSKQETEAAAETSYSLASGFNTFHPETGFHPICFCCGAYHDNGLGVFAAPVLAGKQVAAIWPTRDAWGVEALLPERFLWAALDCPGQFAFMAAGIRTGILGRMTAEVERPAPAGADYLVTGWRVGVDGKKHYAGTAVFDMTGRRIARALAVWIGRRD